MGAWNVSRDFVDNASQEILKFPAGLDAIMSVVVDASTVDADTNGDRKLVAGTLLTGPNGDSKYEQYLGTGDVMGVLADDTKFASGDSSGDQPVAMFFHGCVFRSDRIVDFSTYETAARTDLSTCRFD